LPLLLKLVIDSNPGEIGNHVEPRDADVICPENECSVRISINRCQFL
jgi:hypothetical protein